MHPSSAGWSISRLRLRASALAWLLPPAARAAGTEAGSLNGGIGPWLFACVAMLVVAALAFLAGKWRAGARSVAASTSNSPPVATARPADDGPAPLRQLAASLAADPRPLFLLAIEPTTGERLLAHANAAGLRQLGAGADAVGKPWSTLEAAAPAALRTALSEPGNAGGWWLLRGDGGTLCLALGPEQNGADAETASLVYTVSHDLRAPIRVVEGFTRIVKEDYGRQLDRVGNDHLDRVLAAGARMNQMIDAMLTMARLASQPLTRQQVDLSQLAAFVIEDLRRAAPERHVEVHIDPDLRARGDATLLRLVLENLLGNAWKYSSRTAQARIEFGVAHDASPAPDGIAGAGRRVYMVRDNGAGFDMRVADRLFGLFQRLHSSKDFPGTGVGLASVRRIVQRHGGEVWAQSEPDRGAAFFFTLAD
jgi:signal transduction histidine kinase